MAVNRGRKRKSDKAKRRHRFFLNPYTDRAFSKCPVCETKMKIRKFPLVIHIDPSQLFLMSQECRYCPDCDLIIAGQEQIESLMKEGLRHESPEVVGNKYRVRGTLDREDWVRGSNGLLSAREITERMFVFKDVWNFDAAGSA